MTTHLKYVSPLVSIINLQTSWSVCLNASDGEPEKKFDDPKYQWVSGRKLYV